MDDFSKEVTIAASNEVIEEEADVVIMGAGTSGLTLSLRHILCRTQFYGRVLWDACINGSSELMTNLSMSLVNILYNFCLLYTSRCV